MDASHNLEARAPTKACDRLGNVSSIMGLKVVILGGNLAVSLAYARRRPQDVHSFTQNRRMSAVGLVKGIKFMFRWITSELNVADFDSRNCGPVPSSSQHVSQSSCPVERCESRHLKPPTTSDVIQSHAGKNKSIPYLDHCSDGQLSTASDSSSELFRVPCSRNRVLVPSKAGSVPPKVRTVEPVTVRSGRFRHNFGASPVHTGSVDHSNGAHVQLGHSWYPRGWQRV